MMILDLSLEIKQNLRRKKIHWGQTERCHELEGRYPNTENVTMSLETQILVLFVHK